MNCLFSSYTSLAAMKYILVSVCNITVFRFAICRVPEFACVVVYRTNPVILPFNRKSVHTNRDSCYKFPMTSEWLSEIQRAQTISHYSVGRELFARTKYGDECFGCRPAMTPCHDCGVIMGQLHIPGCNVEECPNCQTQLLSCDCDLGDAWAVD